MNVYVLLKDNLELDSVHVSERLAKRVQSEKGYSTHIPIQKLEVNGYKADDFDYELSDTCKYYNPKLNMIKRLISCLYDLDGCCCGGLAHVAIDDDNIGDNIIKFIIEDCDKPENKDRLERGLVKLIMDELLSITIQQRALLFSGYYTDVLCDNNCTKCKINSGEIMN